MSFILDALKKSEAERQRQVGPALLEMRIVRPTRRLPLWALVVGLLLIVNVMVLAWLAWRSTSASVSTASTASTMAPVSQLPPTAPRGAGPPSTSIALPIETAPPTTVAPPAADNPADSELAIAPTDSAAIPKRGNTAGSVRNYAELSGNLPELRLDLHVYAATPAERYAFINMRKVREGDVTPDGVEVREITREGVVLFFHDTEFLLGRQ